jgi:hypothetical protein
MIEFFDIILFATIFSKMGDGKDSGKLLFKSLFSGSGFTISEDDTSMTFSTTGGGGTTVLPLNEVAFGTGTGITSSSYFVVKTTAYNEGIFNFGSVRQDPDLSKASNSIDVKSNSSFVVGGNKNSICGNESIIVGGYTNSIFKSSRSSIIAGRRNDINIYSYNPQHNTILSSDSACIQDSAFSLILSSSQDGFSKSSYIRNHKHSTIISSKGDVISSTTSNFTYNEGNLIISGEENLIYNSQPPITELGNEYLSLRFNSIISSFRSCIILSSTSSDVSNSVIDFSISPACKMTHNTILSSRNSRISNCISCGLVRHNLLFSGSENRTYQRFSNISGRLNKTNNLDLVSKPATSGLYSQILASFKNYMHTCKSSIISNIGSTSSAGLDTECNSKHLNMIGGSRNRTRCVSDGGFVYSSLLGGRDNYFFNQPASEYFGDSGSDLSVLIGGECNIGNGSTLIIGGCYNRVSTIANTKIFGLTQGLINGENRRLFRDGQIIGGSKNFAGNYSIVLGGFGNYAMKRSVIIGGCDNWAAFQYKPSYTDYSVVFGIGRSFVGVNSRSQDFIIGGSKNCATSGFSSMIVGGCCNVTRNSNYSAIIGGCCNFMEAHGDFSGKERSISGITQSEVYALKALSFFSYPSFNPPTGGGWIGNVSYLLNTGNYDCNTGLYQTQVNNNFIIGGNCNFFGSKFPNSYLNNNTYDLFGIYGTFSGLGKKSTSFILNSGIVGGSCNSIINAYNLWNGTGLYCGTLINSVILGGKGLTVSKSNMVCAGNAIFADTVYVKNQSYTGVSGTFNNPSSIVICNGLIVSVT